VQFFYPVGEKERLGIARVKLVTIKKTWPFISTAELFHNHKLQMKSLIIDAAITMNSVKNRNHAVMSFLADRTAACSTIGCHNNS